MSPQRSQRADVINDFLASTVIFSTAITELLEEQVHTVVGPEFTISQLKLLKLVERTDPGTMSELAAFLGVSNPAASKAVDRLVRRGMLQRSESADDRRAIRLSLTAEGKDVLERYDAAQYETLDGLFRQFMVEDLVEAGELLDRLSSDLVDIGARPDDLCCRCGIYFREKCLLRDSSHKKCYYHLRKHKEG